MAPFGQPRLPGPSRRYADTGRRVLGLPTAGPFLRLIQRFASFSLHWRIWQLRSILDRVDEGFNRRVFLPDTRGPHRYLRVTWHREAIARCGNQAGHDPAPAMIDPHPCFPGLRGLFRYG